LPVYEYECEKCGHVFEEIQSMGDDALTECVKCGGPVHRLLFAPAIHFKGSGFHNTDYGTKKRPKDSDKSGGADAGAGAGSSGGSEGSSGGSGGGDGAAATKTKEATPKDRAARGTGP